MPPTFASPAYGDLEYLDHPYNVTAANERAVEVPLAAAFLEGVTGPVLEIGNVLAHYPIAGDRTVVDLNERGPGVINADVLTWVPPHRFDRIVAVSTVEHVGWDGPAPQIHAAAAAIARLASWLAPGGALLVTVPIGYHHGLDAAIADRVLGILAWEELHVRTGPGLAWEPMSDWSMLDPHERRVELVRRPYDRLTPSATAVWVGLWTVA